MLGKGRLWKSMQKIIILDANAILRYVIDDIKEQADIVQEILQNEKVLILPEVIAEVIYVMTKYYNYPRNEVSEYIVTFLEDADCDSQNVINAVKTFSNKSFDFVDCLLYEYSKQEDYEVFTFDKDLNKLIKKRHNF